MRDLLLMFLKWPEPGRTKTRLIPALGPESAAALYRLLAEAAIDGTRPLAGEYERLLCFSPADAEAKVREWFPGEAVWPQPEGDLGHRMSSAMRLGFERGAERVALVGTDVPSVSRDTVREAFRSLDTADLVIGPARDGGYYLLASKRSWPELFSGVAWSTPLVFAATCERAAALGLRPDFLEAMQDVDAIDDLEAVGERLAHILGRDPGLRDAVARALAQEAPKRSLGGTIGAMTEIKTYLQVLGFIDDKPLRFSSGDVIFAAGQAGDKMYIVRSGSVELRVGGTVLETVVPGGVFGEMALIDPAPRSATAVAGFDCSLAAISVDQFHGLVQKVPNLALEVMKVLARRIRRTNPTS